MGWQKHHDKDISGEQNDTADAVCCAIVKQYGQQMPSCGM
jgi:hypothetical protein